MASVSLTIALASDAGVNCDVSVDRDKNGNHTWRRFGWSIGGLKFGPLSGGQKEATSGRWAYYAPRKELYLFDSTENDIFGTATKVPSDFLNSVTCGKSLGCDGEFWHNGSYRKTNWGFWMGCS